MNHANVTKADTDRITHPVTSDALLSFILGLEGVHAAPRLLDEWIDILCALALQRVRHGGAMMVVACSCCGNCEDVWVCEWTGDYKTMCGLWWFREKVGAESRSWEARRLSCISMTGAHGPAWRSRVRACVRCDVSEVRSERGFGNPLRVSEVRLKAWRWFALAR